MISSILSHDEELEVNNAYAKIGLIANRVWAQDQEDSYVKLNRLLWVQNSKLSEIHEDDNEKKSRRVRDVIPASRLAQYGDYEYDEEREKMYKVDDTSRVTWPDKRDQSYPDDRGPCNEPWMLKGVEDYFVRLTSPIQVSTTTLTKFHLGYHEKIGTEKLKSSCDRQDDFGKYSPPLLYSVLNRAEQQLQARVRGKLVRDLWNTRTAQSLRWERKQELFRDSSFLNDEKSQRSRRSSEKRVDNRKPYEQSMYLDRTLIPRIQSYSESTGAENRKPVFPVLSAEVPEFFPKGPPNADKDRQAPIQFFPSSSERSYQDELFPYNRTHAAVPQNTGCVPIAVSHPATVNTLIRAPHQWIHRVGPPIQIQVPGVCSAVHPPVYSAIQPICPTIIHRPISLHEKIITPGQTNPVPIPVYQRPPELYQESSHRRGKNHHGVDFNNLILLTKSAMKARRNQSKNPQQTSSFILESRQPNLKSERDVLQWLDKGYPKRAREFATVNSLVSELSRFEVKCDCGERNTQNPVASTGEARIEENTEQTKAEIIEETPIEDSDVPIARKRLYRDVLTNTASTELILETVLDRRYDELEQQAMEQYRTSEECLALRYQELERQALEQYKNSESSLSSSESIRAKKSLTICESKDREDEEREDDSREIGARCSGFGNRSAGSPGKDTASGRGSASERQITILRSDNKCPSVPSTTFRSQAPNAKGTTVVTKSLTALTNETFEVNSKNPFKGASGDRIEDRDQSSLNSRHLILVSPLKQSIPLRTDIIADKTISSYYRKPTTMEGGIASGGGDEKVTILRSPSTQVWLSSFWG